MLLIFDSLTDIFHRGITDRQIPTTLSYVDGDEYYGAQAKAFLVRNPTNTIAYFKDFLGQEYANHTSEPS
jgi:molecular chaperone DnaK (HSP70)